MPLINSTRITHRHIKQSLKIQFSDIEKLPQIANRMRAALEKNPQIDPLCPLHVTLRSFGDYACEVEVEAYSTITDQKLFFLFQNGILLELMEILKAMDVQLAIPTMQWQQKGS